MVKRINVTISDELAARVEPWVDSLSPSRLYQTALEDWVTKKEALAERVKGGGADMPAIVERLRQQKAKAERDFYDEGQEEGAAWARAADYQELIRAAAFVPFSRSKHKQGLDRSVLSDDRMLGETFRTIFDKSPDFWKADARGLLSYDAETFVKGWLDAVRAFWEEVAPKIDN